MEEKFGIYCTGHEIAARRLLLKNGTKTADELALMTSYEVEQVVNADFKAIKCGENWLLVPNDKLADFQGLVTWIKW